MLKLPNQPLAAANGVIIRTMLLYLHVCEVAAFIKKFCT